MLGSESGQTREHKIALVLVEFGYSHFFEEKAAKEITLRNLAANEADADLQLTNKI